MADFKCIAEACEETCCAGWYIAIDDATYKKYKKVKNPDMKKRFDKELVVKKGSSPECAAKIKLKNNRCAFLGKDNLCDIYRTLGEQYLSETCTMYPRNTNDLGEKVELSLALSCPEAARRVLKSKEPIVFKEEEAEKLPVVGARLHLKLNSQKHFEDYLLEMRDVLIAIWQESRYNVLEKWQVFESVMMKLNELRSMQDHKKLALYLKEMQGEGYKKTKLISKSLVTQYVSEKQAAKLLKVFVQMRENKKWPSKTYETFFEQMVQGLGEAFDVKKYEEGCKLYEEAIQNAPYILEHYFVNYIYERLVPINQQTPKESLKEMCLYYACIRLHLIGMSAYKGSICEDEIVGLICSFTRVFDHNALYMQQIKKQILV